MAGYFFCFVFCKHTEEEEMKKQSSTSSYLHRAQGVSHQWIESLCRPHPPPPWAQPWDVPQTLRDTWLRPLMLPYPMQQAAPQEDCCKEGTQPSVRESTKEMIACLLSAIKVSRHKEMLISFCIFWDVLWWNNRDNRETQEALTSAHHLQLFSERVPPRRRFCRRQALQWAPDCS